MKIEDEMNDEEIKMGKEKVIKGIEEEKMEKLLKGIPGIGESAFNIIDVREDEKPTEEEKQIIGYKRSRAKKGRKSIDSVRRKKAKLDMSSAQLVFNKLSNKAIIDEPAVREAAKDANYPNLTQDNVDFFISLGKARANLRKYGIPAMLCKVPFHIFTYTNFYIGTQIFTNDYNAWYCYYWAQFSKSVAEGGLKDFAELCIFSKVKEFSIVTDKTFRCKTVQSGYVQDYSKDLSIICPRPMQEKEMNEFAEKVEKRQDGAIGLNITSPAGKSKFFMQLGSVMVIGSGKTKPLDAIAEAKNIQCVNSKNNLQSALKDVKLDENMGSYLNAHDLKITEFSPSCLFITPYVSNPKMFVRVDLETNTVYNYLAKNLNSVKELKLLPLPENAIFWDNIDSAIQMFAFLKLVNKPNKDVENDLLYLVTKSQEIKANIIAWKRLYSIFETVVLSFYDKVSNKLAIDAITSLQAKVNKFITDYNSEKTNVSGYTGMLKIVQILPGVTMMRNFVTTNLAIDFMYAVSRLISILNSVKLDSKDHQLSDLFKTIGLTCFNILFGGSVPMIPRIRSKAAFIGGLMMDMSKAVYQDNINYLVNSYKQNYVASLKPGEAVKIDVNELDDLMKQVARNTINGGDSDYLKANVETIVTNIMSKENLLKSLRDNITTLLEKNTKDDIRSKADFTGDEQFMSYLKTVNDLGKAAVDAGDDAEIDDIVISIGVPPPNPEEKAAKKLLFSKRLVPRDPNKPIFKVTKVRKKKGSVNIKKGKVKKMLKASKNPEKLQNEVNDIIKEVNEDEK